MIRNRISQQQNEPEFIKLLRARSRIYKQSNWLLLLQLLLTVIVPFLGAVFSIFFTQIRSYISIIMLIITLFDIVILDRTIKDKLKNAALICEQFDCNLLKIPDNKFIVGAYLEPEIIVEASETYKGRNKLNNWYPAIPESVPLHWARIMLQRTNLWYDAELRNKYKKLLIFIAIISVFSPITIGFIKKISVGDLLMIVTAPFTLIFYWTLRAFFQQSDAINAQKTTRSKIETFCEEVITKKYSISECARRSRELQDIIFLRRSSFPLIFPGLYYLFRKRMEQNMEEGIKDLLKEIEENDHMSIK